MMLETLKRWFGLTRQQKTNENALTPCYKSLADVPAALDLHDKTIVVCRGGSLVLRKEGELPDTLRAGEVCWIVPRGDVKLSLDFSFDNRQVRAAVTIRFESDAAFARYAKTQPSCITEETLARFVAGEWCELLSLQGIDVQNLTDAARASTFRTHLSLLLQENGFRCVALESIIVCEAKKTVVQDEPTEDMPVEIASEIQTLIEAANSEQKWDGFLDQLDEAGFRPSSVQAEQLATLGQSYWDKKVSLADTVLQVQKMIRRNNRELDRIAEEVALWSAEETKLRLLNSLDAEEEEFLLAAAAPSARVAKVPSTWYLLRKQKVDEKLRRYLKNSVQKLGIKLDAALNRHNSIPAKAQFHPSQQTLKRIADKISMTPGLSSGGSGFRQKRQGYGELLAAVRRSVTAIQLIDGFLSRLISENVTEKEQSDLLGGLESTLETLENEINQRKNIYGV